MQPSTKTSFSFWKACVVVLVFACAFTTGWIATDQVSEAFFPEFLTAEAAGGCGGCGGWWDWDLGVQTHIDGGGGGGGGGCVGAQCNPQPSCTIVATPPGPVAPGTPVTLTWTSNLAQTASISPGVGNVTPPTGGSVVVNPTQNTTYTLTVNHNVYGSAQCQVTVQVTPPNGCILILKETFNTESQPIFPVAQFTFKLDGGVQTAVNDAAGIAVFNNVTPGTHTVTEIVPPTWQQLSVTPANGVIVVPPGPDCVAVVFKNKQVLTPPPTCTLDASPNSFNHPGGTTTLTWTTTNADQISIDEDINGPMVPIAGGSVTADVTQTTTFHFTASGPGGTVTCEDTVVVNPPPQNVCPVPSSLNDSTKQTVNASQGEESLQSILDTDTSFDLSVMGDQKQYQNWTVTSGSHIQIMATHVNTYSALKQVYGYYLNGDLSTFTPIFKTSAIPGQESVPLASSGPFNIAPHVGGTIGFAIKSYQANGTLYGIRATENALNPGGNDQVVAYNPSPNDYVLAFEDVVGGDYDYNDLVVTMHLSCEVAKEPITIKATKVVCENEADLPNWGGGGPNITASTAIDWVNSHDSCRLETGWTFEFAKADASNPGDNVTVGGNGWHPFGPTNAQGVATAVIHDFVSAPDKIWVREQTNSNYIPFTGILGSNVSAEMYCHTDVLNYDNLDLIDNPNFGGTYNCVAFNVPKPPPGNGCIEILKETYNPNGVEITPVAQFTFKLDGNAATVQNNANGYAKFSNVTPGVHTVTEVLPATWQQLSVTPVNGTVTVTAGPICAAVVFKNKQVITQGPACTLTASPTSFNHPGGTTTLTWTTTNATSFTINNGVGSVSPVAGGNVNANVTQNTTFVGTATGPNGTVTCEVPVTVVPPQTPTPACTLTISKNQINTGESVVVSWTSSNVTSGTITPQIGNATPVNTGNMTVFPPSDTTYTGTFTGPYGTVQCSVFVKVNTGGCQGSCGGGFNPPNVVLFQKPGEQPLASVYLAQIPYTGFEAGPILTTLFWLGVALAAALVAYYIVGRGSMRYVFDQVAGFTGVPTEAEIRNDLHDADTEAAYEPGYQAPEPVRQQAMSYSSAAVAAPAMPASVARTEPTGIPGIEDVIESRAHAAGVLMSPEAVSLAVVLSEERHEALRIFGDILNEAVKTLPREDGWIMLTSDRFVEIRDAKRVAVPASAAAPVSAPAPRVEASVAKATEPAMTGAEEASAMQFVGAVLAGDRNVAFNIIRSLEHDGVNPTALITGTATVLDRLYRVRHGGQNGIDRDLVAKSEKVSDENLHKLVEVFTHALDTVYSNPFTGLKLALAQAFEIIG